MGGNVLRVVDAFPDRFEVIGLAAGGNVERLAEQIALTHHEHWNGLGYPRGLAGEAIPLEQLRYWSVERQEAYSSPEAVLKRLRRAQPPRD